MWRCPAMELWAVTNRMRGVLLHPYLGDTSAASEPANEL